MKFNEKLIELRKKEGLSQEELGYKLNVTRQTVSKWELGQTTPEMDKLVEISKLFNVSVDELINNKENKAEEDGTIEDKTIKNNFAGNFENQSNKKTIIIAIIAFVIVILIVIMAFKVYNDRKKEVDNLYDNAKDIMNDIYGKIDEQIDGQIDDMNKDTENENSSNKVKPDFFNTSLEMYSGEQKGIFIKSVLYSANVNNKMYNGNITVKYEDIETKDESEIQEIENKIDSSTVYQVTFEYDTDGYINKVVIEKK